MSNDLSVVILAAGKGTRMRNGIPKVLHPLAGRPLIWHVMRLARELRASQLVVVLAPDMDEVAREVERLAPDARIAIQDPPLGTGHAVMSAGAAPGSGGTVLVLYGDTPLLTAGAAQHLVDATAGADAAIGVLGISPPDPTGYGRLRLDGLDLVEIVEERHADTELRRTGLCNAGVMAFDGRRLGTLLEAVPLREDKGEYYLTDTVALARGRGWRCVAVEGPWQDGIGVNSQAQLAEAERLFQDRRRAELLDSGVIMQAPETVFLAADTRIAPGAVVEPYVVFGQGVSVASRAIIHAFTHLEGATIEEDAQIGPFARLRPGTEVGKDARIGNFVEAKNAVFGQGAKAGHLSYLGDAEIGPRVNVGAGTITCNYDGVSKHRTAIGAEVFIGSNTSLVAPVTIGDGAFIGAGSTITADVPADALALGRARQATLVDRARVLRERMRHRKD